MSLLPLLGLAALTGLLAAWLTVILLVFRGRPDWHLQGLLNRHADRLAAFASAHFIPLVPTPSRFFEQLGPDRVRRELFRHLRGRVDGHVDDMMDRRNSLAWGGLSAYARGRIYAHMHRRLPFAVDNFVEQLHRDMDSIISPRALVHRYFGAAPSHTGQMFLSAFGTDLRNRLPLAALVAAIAGGALAGLGLGHGIWQPAFVGAAAGFAGSIVVLVSLAWPGHARVAWPLRAEGILHRRRHRFLRLLARRLGNEAFAWPAIAGEFVHGPQAPRVRQIMRREVSNVLDTTVFKATLQLLIGPEALVEVKRSAHEKALELMASTPISATLQESCRNEVERSLLHAADQDHERAYAELWQDMLGLAWRVLPPLLAVVGGALGLLAGLVLLPS